MRYRYHLSGYIFETNVYFPELIAAGEEPSCSILVTDAISAKIPPSALTAKVYRDEDAELVCYYKKKMGFIAIWNQTRLEYTPLADTPAEVLKMNILGTVSMLLAASLGYISFHTACIIINNKAVLFCGPSGAGKSSLSAYFNQRGYTVLADDVTNVRLTGDIVTAYPSVPRIKLLDDMLRLAGVPGEGLALLNTHKPKYALPLDNVKQTAGYPVGGIVFLHFSEKDCTLTKAGSLADKLQLRRHLYRKGMALLVNNAPLKNRVLFNLVNSAPMFTFSRPKNEQPLKAHFEFFERELVKLIGQPTA
jgi:hypothetical protein